MHEARASPSYESSRRDPSYYGPAKGMKGAIAKAEEIAQDENVVTFNNLIIPPIQNHEKTNRSRNLDRHQWRIDVFVAALVRGGTSQAWVATLKTPKAKAIISVAVEPTTPVITTTMKGETPSPNRLHKIQALAQVFIPKNFRPVLVDPSLRQVD